MQSKHYSWWTAAEGEDKDTAADGRGVYGVGDSDGEKVKRL